ncbi:hypothetical protein ACFQDF_24935 [Ectobacillus funiculus]|uniref:Uncharacterized protein n=1 Tax=Ectobacillus funiculus TaxID=137993 RepID=A0ABV5WJN7_9BACI
MVCEEDTASNGTAMGGLSRCISKGIRTVLRGVCDKKQLFQ